MNNIDKFEEEFYKLANAIEQDRWSILKYVNKCLKALIACGDDYHAIEPYMINNLLILAKYYYENYLEAPHYYRYEIFDLFTNLKEVNESFLTEKALAR